MLDDEQPHTGRTTTVMNLPTCVRLGGNDFMVHDEVENVSAFFGNTTLRIFLRGLVPSTWESKSFNIPNKGVTKAARGISQAEKTAIITRRNSIDGGLLDGMQF